jgi:hypothetical protein
LTALAIAYVVCGALLVAATQVDVLATALHPEYESPLSTNFQRLVWRALRAARRAFPRRMARHHVLNWGLPLMVAGLIAFWLLLLTLGFALIVYPWVGDPDYFASPNPQRRGLTSALYFSGVTLATLGYGDMQPLVWPLRLLSVLESLSGALTLALGVSYVVSVYPAVSRQRTLATALDAEVAGQASALPMVRRYLAQDPGWGGELSAHLRELALGLLSITEAHETHPVLYYSHPRRVQHSFLRTLVIVQCLVGLLRYGLSPDRHPGIVRNPQLLLLEQALHYSLRRLTESLNIDVIERPDGEEARRRLAIEYEKVCDGLEQLGLVSSRAAASAPVPVLVEAEIATTPGAATQTPPAARRAGNTVTDGDGVMDPALDLMSESPLEAYVTFRLASDPHIAAYASANGYTLEEARADYETTWWVGGR